MWLIDVSIASATRGLFDINPLVMTLALIVLAGLLVYKTFGKAKADQDWYRCRALAESVKT